MIDKNKLLNFIESLSEEDLDKDDLSSEIGQAIGNLLGGDEADMKFLSGLFETKSDKGFINGSLLEEHAFKGSAAAQVILGQLKLGNKILDNDHFEIVYSGDSSVSEGIFWLKRALNGGNPKAGMLLGMVYSGGYGVEVNMFKAREYMQASVEHGIPKAQHLLAVMLLDGLGGPEDEDYAISLMKKAAEWGVQDAIDFLREHKIQ